MGKELQKFNWNGWLFLYGACFLPIYHYSLLAPALYLAVSIPGLLIQATVNHWLYEDQERRKRALAWRDSVAKGVVEGFVAVNDFFSGGEIDNRGLFVALNKEKHRQFAENLANKYYGVSSEQAMQGLSNIKQAGLDAQVFQDYSGGCALHAASSSSQGSLKLTQEGCVFENGQYYMGGRALHAAGFSAQFVVLNQEGHVFEKGKCKVCGNSEVAARAFKTPCYRIV